MLILTLGSDSTAQTLPFPAIDRSLLDFGQEILGTDTDFLTNNRLLSPLEQAVEEVVSNNVWQQQILSAQTSLHQDHYLFYDGQEPDSTVYWGALSLRQTFEVVSFPLALEGTVRHIDGEFDWQRSTIGFSFDLDCYRNNTLTGFWKDRTASETVLGNDLFHLDERTKAIVGDELLFSFYQQLVTSPAYKRLRDSLQQQLGSPPADSLRTSYQHLTPSPSYEQIQDSLQEQLGSLPIDSTQALWLQQQELIKKLDQVEERYTYYKAKISTLPYEEKRKANERLNTIAEEITERYQGTDGLQLTEDFGGKVRQVAHWLRDLDLGYFHLDRKEFVNTDLPMNGISVSTEYAGVQIRTALGKQAFSGFILPSSGIRFLDDQVGNNLFFSEVAWESNKSAIAISALRVGDQTSNSGIEGNRTNGVNWVYGVSGTYWLDQYFRVSTHLFQSQYHLVSANNNVGQTSRTGDNLAGNLLLVYQHPKNVEVGVGYYRRGPAYQSLADPFEQINAHGLEANFKSTLLKNKLRAHFSVRTAQPVDEYAINGQWRRYRARGTISYHPSPNWQVRASFIPNTFRLQNGAETADTRQDIFIGEVNWTKRINATTSLLSQVRITNFTQGLHLQDTAQYFNQLLGEWTATAQLFNCWSVSGSTMLNEQGEVVRVSANTSFSLKKLMLGTSFFTGRIEQSLNDQRGLSGQFRWAITPKINWSLSATNINNTTNSLEATSDVVRWNWYAQTSLITLLN